uniref:Uncharacterized protein n=1 Tax=Gopherus evgoodei TaxID=1825980 RepID=A0A8C4WJU5_9SAUR
MPVPEDLSTSTGGQQKNDRVLGKMVGLLCLEILVTIVVLNKTLYTLTGPCGPSWHALKVLHCSLMCYCSEWSCVNIH